MTKSAKMIRRAGWTYVGLCLLLGLCGCATLDRPEDKSLLTATPAAQRELIETLSVPEQQARIEADLRSVTTLTSQSQGLASEMDNLVKTMKPDERGHFTADENARIEWLLFRYRVCRQALWDMVDYYGDFDLRFSSPENQTKAFIIGFSAAIQLADCGSRLVSTFLEHPMLIAKLNESHHRSEIPPGTYDTIFRSVTSIDHLGRLKAAWFLFSTEMTAPQSPLRNLLVSDAAYREQIDDICMGRAQAEERVEAILEKKSLLLPKVRNRLRQTAIVELARMAREGAESNLDAAQAVLYVTVGSLKDPFTPAVRFTPQQRAEIREALKPGDILLTYATGHMGNVFIPGVFKHGIVYVGSSEERRQAGLATYLPFQGTDAAAQRLQTHIERTTLANEQPADLIEAVSTGVIFNSLDTILGGKASRMVVLRPHLSDADRVQALGMLFEYLGDDYDFDFDFSDDSAQCCTELIYRILQARGRHSFSLVQRFGRPTLAADDIIRSYLRTPNPPFSFILLAERAPNTGSKTGHVLNGVAGEERLRSLMGESHGNLPTRPL